MKSNKWLFATIAVIIWSVLGSVSLAAQPGAYHFGFKKSVDGRLPSIDEEGFKSILTKHGALFLGDTNKKELFLTFDNGYQKWPHSSNS